MKSTDSKTCSRCKRILKTAQFGKNKNLADGLDCQCRDCKRDYRKTASYKTSQARTQRLYFAGEAGKDAKRKYRLSDKGVQKRREQTARDRASGKTAARNVISNAIGDGIIPKAATKLCHNCGAKAAQYHHHKGYDAEHHFDVIPVCRPCHYKLDRI